MINTEREAKVVKNIEKEVAVLITGATQRNFNKNQGKGLIVNLR